jgi:hypothetical protein
MAEIEICNRALGWVGGNRITSLDANVDKSNEANLCRENYDTSLDVVIEEGAWNFCQRRYKLLPLVSAPAWGYAREFLIPSEVIRMLRVTDSALNFNSGTGVEWKVKEDTIESNAEVLYCIAVVRITDTTKFSPGMEHALSARMAMDLAIPLTRKNSVLDSMTKLYSKKMSLAMSFETMQGTQDNLNNSALLDARFRGSGYSGIFEN